MPILFSYAQKQKNRVYTVKVQLAFKRTPMQLQKPMTRDVIQPLSLSAK